MGRVFPASTEVYRRQPGRDGCPGLQERADVSTKRLRQHRAEHGLHRLLPTPGWQDSRMSRPSAQVLAVQQGCAVLSTQNYRNEYERFALSSSTFNNKFIRRIWNFAGVSTTPPRISMMGGDTCNTRAYRRSITHAKKGESDEVPAYIMLQNKQNLKKFRDNILPVISEVCGRTDRNTINCLLYTSPSPRD